jgi:hypothetical protein
VKAYVYFPMVLATGCAYGTLDNNDFPPLPDAAPIHADAGHDVSTVVPEASVQDVATQDEPDVAVVEACMPLPLPTGDPTCDSCIAASCCSEDEACGNDNDCLSLINCMSACTDRNCQATCETTYPTGTNELNALDNCLENTCGTACGS